MRHGAHDGIVAQACSLDAAFHAAPRQHRGIGSYSAFQNLVPTTNFTSARGDKVGYIAHKVTLQAFFGRVFAVGRQAFLLDASLTARTFCPANLRAFVAADVHILGREDVHHLRKYVFGKL